MRQTSRIFSRAFWSPYNNIKEIEIDEGQIFIKKKNEQFRYTWDDIAEARLIQNEYETENFIRVRKILILRTSDNVFSLDVSEANGEITNPKVFLQELKAHVRVHIEQIKRLPPKRSMHWAAFAFLAVFALGLALWQFHKR